MTREDYWGPRTKLTDRVDEDREDIECNRCGKAGLHWEELDVGWRLYEANQVRHVCHAKADPADDFQEVRA
jgi:hypothetical protein